MYTAIIVTALLVSLDALFVGILVAILNFTGVL